MINHTTERHLLIGYCLLVGCELCSGGHAMSASKGLNPHTLVPKAEDIWRRNKARLLTLWRDSAGIQGKPSGFSSESLRGGGRTGIPCWAEIFFEGAKLPRFDKLWPADVKKIYRELK